MNKQEFICPKCGSDDWEQIMIESAIYAPLNGSKLCKKCAYRGTFFIKESGNLSKEEREMLQEVEDIKKGKKRK